MTNLETGIFFTLVTGLLWSGVGIIMSKTISRNINYNSFMFSSALFFMIYTWIFLPDYSTLNQVNWRIFLYLGCLMTVAGITGQLGFLVMQRAMSSGPHGITWAISQCSVVFPFLVSVFFFDEPIMLFQFIGLLLFVTSLACLARTGTVNNKDSRQLRHWLLNSFLSFGLIGCCQVFSSLPSYFESLTSIASFRLPIMSCAGCLVWLVAICFEQKIHFKEVRGAALNYSLAVLAGQICFLKAIDVMAKVKVGGLVFPIAISICILLVFIYGVLVKKDKIDFIGFSGAAFAVTGIILMILK